jgi:hypothetical protein
MLNDFLIGKRTCDKGLFEHSLLFVCSGGIYHIKLKNLV